MSWQSASALVALLGLALGCATKPPSEQHWVEVRTPHFRTVSALPRPATDDLALDLELFRRAVELLAGAPLPAEAQPIDVFAFDDRRLGPSFSHGEHASYLLASPDHTTLVLRAAGGWRGDAGVALRHDFAHALLRGRDGFAAPLWYDEGIAQLASTIEVRDGAASIGGLRADHLRALRSGPRMPVRTTLDLESFAGPQDPQRAALQAESWSLLHYLFFGQRTPRHLPRQLLVLARADRVDDALLERELQLTSDDLDRGLQHYPVRAQGGALEIRSGAEAGPPFRARPLPTSEVLVELGELALALDRSSVARHHFERALASEAQAARVQAGLGAADGLDGQWTQAAARLESALTLAPGDPRIERAAADLWLARAKVAEDPDTRQRYAERAREHYRQSLTGDPTQAGAHAGIASSHLVAGQALDAALQALERAEAQNPASGEIRLLRVQWLLASGQAQPAHDLARAIHARLHDPPSLPLPGDPLPAD